MKIKFILNNKKIESELKPGLTLLEYLRENGVYSVKYGCDSGECGACTVLVDSKAQNSCLMLLHTVNNCKIETVESFSDHKNLHPLQKSFLEEGAVQCGYCTPGMILSAEALIRDKVNPDEGGIKDALAGNLCRCTGYVKPIKAVQK
ncbi:MAG: 2Fe-2S iron-sulfur cluster binding domain-containing protein [Planctomycetia bacterium]|nr:2Fe-2S iron-sulfur cluster binding domain-containing protein [Planctomycetia bacterium]